MEKTMDKAIITVVGNDTYTIAASSSGLVLRNGDTQVTQ